MLIWFDYITLTRMILILVCPAENNRHRGLDVLFDLLPDGTFSQTNNKNQKSYYIVFYGNGFFDLTV